MLEFLFSKTPLAYFVQSLWRDEAFTYLLAKKDLLKMFILSAKDFTPPVYSLILHFWMKVFGSSEIAIRSLSLVFFFLGLYFFYLFLANVLKIKTRLLYLYMVLYIINPFLNYYAFEARGYSAFSALALMSFYFFNTKKSKAYFISTLIGLYNHYYMLFVLFTQAVLKPKRIKEILKPFYFFIPWLIFTLTTHVFVTEQFWIKKSDIKTFLNFPSILYTGYESGLNFFDKKIVFLTLILLFVLIFGFIKTKGKNLYSLFFLWAFLTPFIAYLVSFYKPIFFPRYLIFAAPGILLLLVASLEKMKTYLKIFFVLIIFVLTLQYNRLQVENRKKSDLRKVVKEIRSQAKNEDLLYVTSELDFHTAQYYFGEKNVFIFNKTYEEIPQYVGKVLIPKDSLITTLPTYPHKAFILKDDLTYEIQSIY